MFSFIFTSKLILLFLGSFLLSVAQEERGALVAGDGTSVEDATQRRERLIKRADVDGDGVLSLEEFSATPKLQYTDEVKRERIFKYLDKNSDGVLASEELPLRPPSGRRGRYEERFRKVDANGDGEVSQEEFLATPPPRLERISVARLKDMFSRLDRNNDGVLSRSDGPPKPPNSRKGERGRGGERKASVDGSGNAFPPHGPRGEELRGERLPPPHIVEALDADDDGQITKEEFLAGELGERMSSARRDKMFKRLDKNQDGVLSAEDKPRHHIRDSDAVPRF